MHPRRTCFLPLTRRADPAEAQGAASRYGGHPWASHSESWPRWPCCQLPAIVLVQLRTDTLPGRPIPFEDLLVQVRTCPRHPTRVAACLLDARTHAGAPALATPRDPAAIAITGWVEHPDAPRAGEGLIQRDKLLGHPIVIQEWTAEILGDCPECGAPARPLFTVNDWISARPSPSPLLPEEERSLAARNDYILAAQGDVAAPLDARPATPLVFGDAGWLTVLFCPEHPTWVRAVTAQM